MLTCKTADNSIRWKEGERLQHLFEQRCDELHAASSGPRDAAVTDDAVYTFRDLDNRANQVARFLIGHGLTAGDRIGLLFDKSVHTYVALLAVLKIDAAYVPFDASFPNERIGFILKDAGVKAIVSMSPFRQKLSEFSVTSIFLDTAERDIDDMPVARLADHEKPAPVEQLAYIIYTSGTTGTPKGVAIDHPSICNFVRVAAEVYGMRPGDRCYQGMTIAFDFSVEELWVPLIAGATLVPGKAGSSLVGSDLADFLLEKRVSVLACVPTLLASIETDLPDLRILLVSGEACPPNLVTRWHRPGRTILNAYGPTEATVTATLTELYPDKPVTIGGPLPTYSIVILDAEKGEEVEPGALGEIGIAGIGLARGYLNRPDLTQQKFVPDFLNIANNPSRRIYRTGDLGRINEQDEVEFHGRIDTQVKIRGYRIELTEIESVLMQLPQIAQAVVDKYESEPGIVELVAYYSLKQGASAPSSSVIAETLRKHLPAYMIPSYIEQLPVIPLTSSNKADRKSLPAPKGPRFSSGSSNFVAPRTKTEEALARALIKVMKIERVSIEDNFFKDLGAHSLLMAHFCSEIRNGLQLSVSMRDIYLHPTIEGLAQHIEGVPNNAAAHAPRTALRIPSDVEYLSCGALQLLYYIASGVFGAWLVVSCIAWIIAASGLPNLYLRAVACLVGSFILLNTIPVAAKWLLIGKWTETTFPIWSLQYFRFWLVKNLVASAPMALFAGTPVYNVYLRLLGAKIGRNVVIKCRFFPVCTDLISIGDGTILRKDSVVLGYKAQSNYIFTGPITIGARAFVGEGSVLDINAAMGDGTQLGHSSSLQSGQRIPANKRYHGSPAQETTADYCAISPRNCTALIRALYTTVQAVAILGAFSIFIVLAYYLAPLVIDYVDTFQLTFDAPGTALWSLTATILWLSLIAFFAPLVLGLPFVFLVPRLFQPLLRENKVYTLYGFHYYIYGIVSAFSNSTIYNNIFGDSSAIIPYLRFVGYNLNKVEQTGSNFGSTQKHENPFLCDIGGGTMVSDRLSMVNVEMSNSSFELRQVKIGANNYLGNNIVYPAGGRTGANCLLGTKVMVPIDGPLRENVGLLGSPCFEIPRAVERDRCFAQSLDSGARRRQVLKKNRHNFITMSAVLACNWLLFFVTTLVVIFGALYYPRYGVLPLVAAGMVMSVVAILFYALMEKASLGFRRLEPTVVSIFAEPFWDHERYWKFADTPLSSLFKGTPFKNMISRLLGLRVGKKVFDDGSIRFETTLIEIGDYVNLNESCTLQGHSLEEGVFKSDRIKIGNGCTIGTMAFVHYGVTMGENVVLEADSFLMKGESPGASTTWHGNPAREARGIGAD